ncbi:MAG TPA: hypothetical protein DDX98_05885 [Bacteroidales bacterium]|nr:hypothetical protein [Bacteroidales bacterium]
MNKKILLLVVYIIFVPIIIFYITNFWAKISYGGTYVYDIKLFLFYYMFLIFILNLIISLILYRIIFKKKKYYLLLVLFISLLIFNMINLKLSF